MFATLLLTAALAQDSAALPVPEPTPLVVDVAASPALRRAEGLVIGGRATFVTSAAVVAASGVLFGVGIDAGLQGQRGWDLVGVGTVGAGLGVVGMMVGGAIWGVGDAQRHRHLEVAVAPTSNGVVVAGRF